MTDNVAKSAKVKKDADKAKDGLENAKLDFKAFSASIRTIYEDTPERTEASKDYLDLRTVVRSDAEVYRMFILPLSKRCVRNIKGYLINYTARGVKEEYWLKALPYLISKLAEYEDMARTLSKIHELFATEMKVKETKAKTVVKQVKGLTEKYNALYDECIKRRATKRGWGIALCFAGPLGAIVGGSLLAVSDKDLAEAAKNSKQAKITGAAAIAIEKTLLPALKGFIRALDIIAGFFANMETDLIHAKDNAEELNDNNEALLIFYAMKQCAVDVQGKCDEFISKASSIKTDLESVTKEGIEQAYLDAWEKKQKGIIEEFCKNENNKTKMLKTMYEKV